MTENKADVVTGEIVDDGQEGQPVEETQALTAITRGEIDIQIATAKRFPRSMVMFKKEALEMATLDPETAESCVYAVPRGGKTITGPSARLAEILGSAYGHLRVQCTIIGEDDRFVTVRAMCWDIQKNVVTGLDVRRRITDSKGRTYNDDMIGVTTAAASVIALRNVRLQTIPKAFWLPIYNACLKVIRGDATTLSARRKESLDYFAKIGVTNEQVFRTLDVKGVEDVTLDHLVVLRGYATAIRDEGTSIESVFGDHKSGPTGPVPDPWERYLNLLLPHRQELAGELVSLVTKTKINKGQLMAQVKKFETNPEGLRDALQAMVSAGDAKPESVKTDTPAEPEKPIVPADIAGIVRGSSLPLTPKGNKRRGFDPATADDAPKKEAPVEPTKPVVPAAEDSF